MKCNSFMCENYDACRDTNCKKDMDNALSSEKYTEDYPEKCHCRKAWNRFMARLENKSDKTWFVYYVVKDALKKIKKELEEK